MPIRPLEPSRAFVCEAIRRGGAPPPSVGTFFDNSICVFFSFFFVTPRGNFHNAIDRSKHAGRCICVCAYEKSAFDDWRVYLWCRCTFYRRWWMCGKFWLKFCKILSQSYKMQVESFTAEFFFSYHEKLLPKSPFLYPEVPPRGPHQEDFLKKVSIEKHAFYLELQKLLYWNFSHRRSAVLSRSFFYKSFHLAPSLRKGLLSRSPSQRSLQLEISLLDHCMCFYLRCPS